VTTPANGALSFDITLSSADPGSNPSATFPDYSSTAPYGSISETTPANGALSFDITPSSAEIWVDGFRAGVAGDFGAIRGPLELTPGPHAVEIRLSGYRTIAFEVEVVAGQVLPYRGTMQHEYY
jgi:hypothetical protein